MEKIKVLNIQFTPIIGDKVANCNKVGEYIAQNASEKPDLVVIPEFFSTGIDDESFVNSPENENSSYVLNYFCELARQFSTNIICGSVIEQTPQGQLFNTSYAIDRMGKIVGKYRKIHLYNYLGGCEGKKISAGDTPVVVEFDFGKVGMSVCFDIRYSEHYRKLIKMGAEIIVSPSAWCNLTATPEDEMAEFINTWRALNVTRAAESLVYFISSNQVGLSYSFLYSIGNSMAVSPLGKILYNLQNTQCAKICELDLAQVRKLKKDYPIYNIN